MTMLLEWLMMIGEPTIRAVVLPVAWLVALLGQGPMGMTDQEMVGKYAYITEDHSYESRYAGTACNTTTLPGGSLCGPHLDLLQGSADYGGDVGVVVLFAPYWRDTSAIPAIVRHEMEHLLRADGLRPGSTYDEEGVRDTACAFAYHRTYCR